MISTGSRLPFKRIVVTGGAGYVGCRLIPKLLAEGYETTVYDAMYFGRDGLPCHPSLRVIEGDIRDNHFLAQALEKSDAVIHLACISNDPSFELDPNLGKSINYDCFEPMIRACQDAGVQRFIYASTSSVYGVSDEPEVREEHPLRPLTDYSKYKGLCEQVLKEIDPNFTWTIIRPATVCGYSSRMRLDLVVNILVNLAYHKKEITVFGGEQKRPNIHIEDMADLYVGLLQAPAELINRETFNAGFQNNTVNELARMIKRVVEEEAPDEALIKVTSSPTNDLRSYHICSEKIEKKLKFTPRRSIEDAVRELCRAFKEGRLPKSLSDPKYFNVRTMKTMLQAATPT